MTKISERNFLLAYNNPRLIKGALKRAHVWPHADIYEDLYQEGLIIYATNLERWGKEKTREFVDYYSYLRIYWHALDELRGQQKMEEQLAAEEAINYREDEGDSILDWDSWIILKDKMPKLPQIERIILTEHLLDFKTLAQISRDYHLSPRTLHRHKKQLIKKLKIVLNRQNMER